MTTPSTVISPPVKVAFHLPRAYASLLWILGGIVAAWIVSALPFDLAPMGKTTLSIFVFTIALWIGEIVPTGIAAMVWAGLLVLSFGKTMPAATIFSGFAADSIWLMIGAFLIGQATSETGLAKRIAYSIMARGGASYNRALLLMWVAMFALGALVPSGTVRMAIFIPIMYAIGAAFNVTRDKTFAANLFLNVYWSSMAAEILWFTGSANNVIALGVLQQLTGYHQTWLGWAIAQAIPVIIFSVGTYWITNTIFKPKTVVTDAENSTAVADELRAMGPTTNAEWRAAGFFLLALVMWSLEQVIHIPSAWTAAFVAAAMFIPGVGVLNEKSIGKISWNTVLLLGVALGIGNVMAFAKVDVFLTHNLLAPIFAPLAGMGAAGLGLGIGIFSFIFHFIMPSGIAQTGALSPVLIKFAMQAGFDPRVAAFVIPRASSELLLFPYQSLPIMVLWGTGYLDMKRCLQSMGVMVVFLLVWITLMAPYWGWISHLLNF